MVLTGAGCFLSGALAWHFVGFWAFVSAIVYNPDDTDSVARPLPVQKVAAPAAAPVSEAPGKAETTIAGLARPPAASDTLSELLQCAEARKTASGALVTACPPLRQRLPIAAGATRGNRQLDAREAARRLATGWQTGIATIETGSIPKSR